MVRAADVEPAVASSSEGEVHESWREPVMVTTWLIPFDGDRWSALAQEYDIIGAGDTPEAAIAEMDELLNDYRELIAAEGRLPADALRPVSGWRLFRLHAGRVWGNVVDAVHQVRHVQRLPHESHCVAH